MQIFIQTTFIHIPSIERKLQHNCIISPSSYFPYEVRKAKWHKNCIKVTQKNFRSNRRELRDEQISMLLISKTHKTRFNAKTLNLINNHIDTLNYVYIKNTEKLLINSWRLENLLIISCKFLWFKWVIMNFSICKKWWEFI